MITSAGGPPSPQTSPGGRPPRCRKVLVVDDDDGVREVAKVALEIVGNWEVITARSGGEAVVLAETQQPDVVLLDVMMPGIDGPSTVQRLRDNPATGGVPIIFLTAKVPSADTQRWGELGLAGVLAKPFDPLTLAKDISRMLGWEP